MIRNFTHTLRAGMLALTIASLATGPALAEDSVAAAPTLYERLGGWDGIQQIARDTIAMHQRNPAIGHYFTNVDSAQLEAHVTAFFAAGSGGPAQYAGRDMTTAHAGMKITTAHFDIAVSEVMRALDQSRIGDTERAEVAAILESLRPAVMAKTGG